MRLHETYLGIGSNIGDRKHNLIRAVKLLSGICTVMDCSSLYSTSPVGYPDQAEFLNMVVKVDASRFDPEGFLAEIKSIEHSMGREKTFRWGPRVIDIDILYAEDVQFSSEDLHIPHRELMNRLFVLVPLGEITESLVIEGIKISVEKRIRELSTSTGTGKGQMVALHTSKESLNIDE